MITFQAMTIRTREAKDLAEYVEAVMREKNLTMQDIEDRSKGEIDRTYVSKILSRAVRNLSTDKIIALANGLGVRVKELAMVALGEPAIGEKDFERSQFYELMKEYEHLDKAARQDFDAAIKLIVDGARARKK